MVRSCSYLFCLSLVFILGIHTASSQPVVEKSEPIDELYARSSKCLLQLSNGNTFAMRGETKNSFKVIVFDKDRKKVAETSVECEHVKLNDPVLGAYEINGEAVIFCKQYYGRAPSLYRLRLNATTGALIAEDEIVEMPGPGIGAAAEGGDGYIIAKDPLSDHYAVAVYRNGAGKDNERVRVFHYDGGHHLLNSAAMPHPNSSIKKFYLMSLAVNGDKSVFVAAYGAESIGHRNGRIYISRMTNGDKAPMLHPLGSAEGLKETHALLKYNSRRNVLQMLVNTQLRQGISIQPLGMGNVVPYSSSVWVVDPETLNVRWAHELGTSKVTEAKKRMPGKDSDYSGVAQDMIVRDDGSVVILMEELEHSGSSPFASSGNYTNLCDIGMVVLENDSVERSGYYMQRRQPSLGAPDPNRFGLHAADLVMTAKGTYLLADEIPENIKRKEEGKRLKTAYRRDRQVICYSLHDGKAELLPLLTKGTGQEDEFESFLSHGNYNAATRTFVTITRTDEGSETVTRIRWVTFE